MLTAYSFVTEVPVRWRDLDAFRHVNNAAVVTYLEVARADLWHEVFHGVGAMDIPFVIAKLEIEYKRPIELYDRVRVGIRTADIGRTSFAFEYLVLVDDDVAAIARTVQVCVRHETGRPVRVPGPLRASLEELSPPP